MSAKPVSANASALIEKLLSFNVGLDRATLLATLEKWGEYALQTLIYLLSGTVPPVPPAKRAAAGPGKDCCDHAACCCEVNAELAKAIEAGCGHCCPECDHCECAEEVCRHVGQAYCLALRHYAACQGDACEST